MVVRGRSINPVVELFSSEVDSKGYKSDAEARSGVEELVGEHRMLPHYKNLYDNGHGFLCK